MKKMMKYFALSLLMFGAAVHGSPIAQSAAQVDRAVKAKKTIDEIGPAYREMYEALLKANGEGLRRAQKSWKRVASFDKEIANRLQTYFPLPKNSLSRARAQLQQTLSAKKIDELKIRGMVHDYLVAFFINGGKLAKSDEALKKQIENKLGKGTLNQMMVGFKRSVGSSLLAERVPGLKESELRAQQEEQPVIEDVSDDTSSVSSDASSELSEAFQEDEERSQEEGLTGGLFDAADSTKSAADLKKEINSLLQKVIGIQKLPEYKKLSQNDQDNAIDAIAALNSLKQQQEFTEGDAQEIEQRAQVVDGLEQAVDKVRSQAGESTESLLGIDIENATKDDVQEFVKNDLEGIIENVADNKKQDLVDQLQVLLNGDKLDDLLKPEAQGFIEYLRDID